MVILCPSFELKFGFSLKFLVDQKFNLIPGDHNCHGWHFSGAYKCTSWCHIKEMRTFLRALCHHCAVSSVKSLQAQYVCWNCKNYRRALIQTNISLYATLSSSPHKNLSITFDGFSQPSRKLWNFFWKNLRRWIFGFRISRFYFAPFWPTSQQESYFPVYPKNFCLERISHEGTFAQKRPLG